MKKLQISVCTAQNPNQDKEIVEKEITELFKELKGLEGKIVFLYGGSVGGYMTFFGNKARENGFTTMAVLPMQYDDEFLDSVQGKGPKDEGSDLIVRTGQSFGGRNESLVRSGNIVLLINGNKFGSGSLLETILAYHNKKKIFVLKSTKGLAEELEKFIAEYGTDGFMDPRKKIKPFFFENAKELAQAIKKEIK